MKIAWAFEPSGISKKHIRTMDALIKAVGGSGVVTELVHVESEIYPSLAEMYGASFPYLSKRDVMSEVDTALRKSGIALHARHRHYIDLPVYSLSGQVGEIVKVARTQGCEMIALYTHALRGMERFALGSFAETLVHRSDKDLLLASPNTLWGGQMKKILFLDDFSRESRAHLRKAMILARRRDAKLVVFHQPHPVYDGAPDPENPVLGRYRRDVNDRKREIEKNCRAAGVSVEVILDARLVPTSEAALKLAQKLKVDLIVLAAKAGKLSALLGGSVTRQILRRSRYPMLVLKSVDPKEKLMRLPRQSSGKNPVAANPSILA